MTVDRSESETAKSKGEVILTLFITKVTKTMNKIIYCIKLKRKNTKWG